MYITKQLDVFKGEEKVCQISFHVLAEVSQ